MVNGDSTLIQTTSGKNILIDTGEEENIIVEYLLDRRIAKLDYVIISHFDSDHCANCIEIIKKIKVKKIVISKQIEHSKNFEEIIKFAQIKKVKIVVVQAEDVINIDKYTNIQILSPIDNSMITENGMNNNSIVCKLNYKQFSMLFTGDIEEITEKQILEKYKNNLKIFNSDILKVAHHGSKTSSTIEFIKRVKPQIAVIGVGKNNKFGHPNDEVIKRLENIRSKNL